jgi:hypothetical protein
VTGLSSSRSSSGPGSVLGRRASDRHSRFRPAPGPRRTRPAPKTWRPWVSRWKCTGQARTGDAERPARRRSRPSQERRRAYRSRPDRQSLAGDSRRPCTRDPAGSVVAGAGGTRLYVDAKPRVANRRGPALADRVSFLRGLAVAGLTIWGAKRRTPVVVVREPIGDTFVAGRSPAGGHRHPPMVVGRPGPRRGHCSWIGSSDGAAADCRRGGWSGQASTDSRQRDDRPLNSVNAVRVVPRPVHRVRAARYLRYGQLEHIEYVQRWPHRRVVSVGLHVPDTLLIGAGGFAASRVVLRGEPILNGLPCSCLYVPSVRTRALSLAPRLASCST